PLRNASKLSSSTTAASANCPRSKISSRCATPSRDERARALMLIGALLPILGAIGSGCAAPAEYKVCVCKLDSCSAYEGEPIGTIDPPPIPAPPKVQIRSITPNNPVVICAYLEPDKWDYSNESDAGLKSRVELWGPGATTPTATHELGPGFAS